MASRASWSACFNEAEAIGLGSGGGLRDRPGRQLCVAFASARNPFDERTTWPIDRMGKPIPK
ncbi:MAG: hypothetical protein RJA99_3989 [Pseudomonadota bacterium]